MSGCRAKRARKEARRATKHLSHDEVKSSLKTLTALHFIEPLEPLDDDPDKPRSFIVNSPERALELALADPNVYKTPKGHLISMEPPDGQSGISRWMTPEEAIAWKVNAEAIDRDNPGGTKA